MSTDSKIEFSGLRSLADNSNFVKRCKNPPKQADF